MERLKFVDASYNQGVGRTLKERMICGLRKGCDPQKWDGNVALVTTATGIIYGRPAYEISRHHVEQTTTVRINKYKNYL
jgi:membrane-bound lytic murein transglycosylase MltF